MHSLRDKISAIVLAFLILVSTAFVIYSRFTAQNYKNLRLAEIEKTVEFETEKVNETITEIERTAIFLATSGRICFETQSKGLGEDIAIDQLKSFPTIMGAGFWFAPYKYNEKTFREGTYAQFDKKLNEPRLKDTLYDYHSLNWYKELFESTVKPYQAAWTAPYTGNIGSNVLMTTAGAGIFNESGELIGVSTIDWEIESVIDELTAIKPTDNSFVLLSVPEKDYVISNTYANDTTGASLSSLPWDTGADEFELDGITYKTFKRVINNGWVLSVQIPANEIFEKMENQNNSFTAIILLVSLLMLCCVFILISILIIRPLKKLTGEVCQLGKGNLDIHASVNTKDELGVLAETFNKISSDLKKHIKNIESITAEKERISAELDVATKIQASMLPCIFPAFPFYVEFEIYANMQPAREVGGDFYDFFLIDNRTLAVVIADVSGKGVPAALFMVIAKTLIKNNAQYKKSPKKVFETVNNILCENNDANMFVTAILGYLDIITGKFTYVNAGHNPILMRSDGKYDWLKAKPNFVLAGMENMLYNEHEIVLSHGDELFLYTDGLTEAMNEQNELYGNQRLLESANRYSKLSPRDFISSVKQDIHEFSKGTKQADDITMLVLRYKGVAMNEIFIEAKLDNMEKVQEFVRGHLGECPPKTKNQISIAVDEIFSNICHYAYHPETGCALVRVTVDSDITIEFEDNGVEYNPLTSDSPDVSLSLDERETGGLGIFMVKNIMDSVEYCREANKNILRIKKWLDNPQLNKNNGDNQPDN